MARSKKPNNDQFRNKFETAISKQLSAAQGEGLIDSYAYEAESIPYTTTHTYTPDWKVNLKEVTFWIETKGYLRPEDKRKMINARDQNPDYDIRIVFQKDLPSYKGSKKKYSDWARDNGFTYAIGEIPKEWFS